MSAILQVIGREMRVRALMPATGAVTAIGLLITAWLSEGGRRFTEIAETSLPIAGFFLAAGGVLMGALILARDLEGSRSLFWLARPIGAMTAFIGKFLAALILVIATTVIVAIPAVVVDPGLLEEPLIFSGAAGFAVACVALGATLGLLLRNRSAWFLAAAAVIIGYGAGAWAVAQPLLRSFGSGEGIEFVTAIVVVFVAALVSAHAVAFVRGRHDSRAQARILTLVLAAILGGALLLAGSFVGWLLSLDVDDFELAYVRAGAGDTLVLDTWRSTPITWGRMFAVDLERGESIPLDTGVYVEAVSPARIFYANRIRAGVRQYEILAVDLGAEPRTRTTGVVHTGYISALATPRDGSRVAVIGTGGVQVYDVQGNSLGSFAAGRDTSMTAARFVDPDRLRIYGLRKNDTVIREADLRSRSIRTVGSLPQGSIYGYAGGDRLVLRVQGAPKPGVTAVMFSLHDARSGNLVFTFPEGTRGVLLLRDGTWAVSGELGENNVARVSSTGEILSAGRVGTRRVRLGGEVGPKVVSLVEVPVSASQESRQLILADPSTWRVMKSIPDFGPARAPWLKREFDEPDSPAAQVFTRSGDLYTIDPETLEPTKLELR